MTIKRLINVIAAAGLLGAFGTANAVSIVAVADSTDVVEGGQVTVDFFGNFSDDPTVGGTFDILFDAATLSIATYDAPIVGDPGFFVPADVFGIPGNIQGGGFGDFGGVGGDGLLLATVVFDVLSAAPGRGGLQTSISMQDGTGGGGGFFSAVTFGPQIVDYQGVTLNVAPIPLPAAAWLMMGGLGALFGFGRKKA